MSRVHAMLGRLGALGVIGLGVLAFCVPFYLSALLPAERELAAQREAAERLRARTPFRAVSADDRADELRRFYGLLPPVGRLDEELGRIYALAQAARLELMQGEYRLEKRSAGPIAYRITLPVRGGYSQIRSFLDAVLREVPIASVDGLRFERKRIADSQLDAQLRLTLHFRPGEDGETR
jgi:hypothetical protein